MANVKEITTENFKSEVESGVTLIKFGAPWCGPCRQLAPIIESLATEITNATVGDCNIDNNGELAQEFGIRSVPTTLIFKDGKLEDSVIGVETVAQLTARINNLI